MIKDLVANQGKVNLELEVRSLEEPRTFNKFGKEGRVCNAIVADASGEVTLTLWNDDVDKIKAGDKIKLENGWCSEFKGQKQISAGKYGKLEVVNEPKLEAKTKTKK